MTMMTMMMLRLLLLCLLLITVLAIKEPRTGIDFPKKYNGYLLEKLGIRTKGPIKVYTVGQYRDTFLLKMNMGVGTEKMSVALCDALQPHCKDTGAIADFEVLLKKGCPAKGVSTGMSLAFDMGRGKLSISVNDKNIRSIGSKLLSQAFKGIYTDKNAVCKLAPIGDGSEEVYLDIGAFLMPRNCILAGATVALGYGIGKYFVMQGVE